MNKQKRSLFFDINKLSKITFEPKHIKLALVILAFIFILNFQVYSESYKIAVNNNQKNYVWVERTDLRRYDNGKYTGLTSREVRSFVKPISAPKNTATVYKNNSWFSGDFLIFEQTKSSGFLTATGLDDIIPTTFHISSNGELKVVPKDYGYPTLRSFPSYPTEELKKGDSWVATAIRVVDPLNTGVKTKLEITVQYTFLGEEVYKGEDVYHIKAKWATRYGSGTLYKDYEGDPNLTKAVGTHDADIMVLIDTGNAILIRDTMDETFAYKNGQTVQYKGTALYFTEYSPAVNKSSIISEATKIATVKTTENFDDFSEKNDETKPKDKKTELEEAIIKTQEEKPKNDIVVEDSGDGIKISVRNLQFIADSSELLANEKSRLDEIAKLLKLAPDSTFLVEGYSASTGNPTGEKRLSKERAKKIVDELVKRGISEKQFIYYGRGSENPIADNSTPEGKAQNRRVEISIM